MEQRSKLVPRVTDGVEPDHGACALLGVSAPGKTGCVDDSQEQSGLQRTVMDTSCPSVSPSPAVGPGARGTPALVHASPRCQNTGWEQVA